MTADLAHPDTYTRGIPHDVFRALRAEQPVSWREEPGGPGYWAVARYDDCVQVLRSPQVYSSWLGSVVLADPPHDVLVRLRQSMMNSDPPEHTILRRMVNKALNPRQIERLDQRVAHHAHQLIAQIREAGSCDFAMDVAAEMPLYMICEILGVPQEDRRALYALTDRMFSKEMSDLALAMRELANAMNEMRAYAAELRAHKLAAPGDDLASELLAAEVDGRRLTPEEFDAFFMLLFNAGSDTTRSLLCYGLDLLIDRPALVDRLARDPEAVAPAVEEMLRYESPVIQIRRTTTQDTVLAGTPIAKGQKVVTFFPSANRDEAVFRDPDTFDIDRSPNPHIAFGFGAHFCLGAPLARLEARHMFRELVAQLRDVERAAPIMPVRTNFVRGIRKLEITFRAR